MKLSSRNLLVIYLLVIVGISLIIPTQPDWRPKYGSADKDPLGAYVLYEQLNKIFPFSEIEKSTIPAYNTLKLDSTIVNYVVVNDVFSPDKYDVEILLDFIHSGGNAFVSVEEIGNQLTDTLGISLSQSISWVPSVSDDSSRVSLQLTNRTLSDRSARINGSLKGGYFPAEELIDSVDFEVLGYANNQVNFIRISLGEGMLYLHQTPAAFSNYGILYRGTGSYAAACLSYLPEGKVLFDDYYKSGKPANRNILGVLFFHAPLRWAWNIGLISIVLFMIFGARRKVRPIPVIRPYENDSVNYVRTIGSLYYQHRDNRAIAMKRQTHLKNFLNKRYRISVHDWTEADPGFFEHRTNVSAAIWNEFFEYISALKPGSRWELNDLRKFSAVVDQIYNEIKK